MIDMRWIKVLALCVLGLGGFLETASAATRVWSAPPFGGDRRWSVPANWAGVAPANGDSIVFVENAKATFPQESTNNLSNLQLVSVSFSGLNNAVPDVFGNLITLSGGITESVDFWGAAFFVPITLSASQIFESSTDGGLDLTNINLSTHTLTLHARTNVSNLEMRGRISGSGNITVTGLGRVTFGMLLTNTYTGLTRVLGGELGLRGGTAASPIPTVFGDVIVGDGTNAARVAIHHDHQIEGDVTVNASAEVVINGASEAIPSLTLNDGEVLTQGDGLLGLAGPVTVGGTSNSLMKGSFDLGSASRTFTVGSNVLLRVEGFVSGFNVGISRPGITKNGAGTLLLASNSTFTGHMNINAGRVIAAAPRALGTESGEALGFPFGRTFVSEGGELMLAAVRITNEMLTLSTTQGGLSSIGACAWIGDIFVNTNVPVNVSNSSLTLDCAIAGGGGLVKRGAGTLTLTGTNANTFTGPTRLEAGLMLLNKPDGVMAIGGSITVGDGSGGANADILRVAASEQIPDTANVNIGFSGQLDLNAEETINILSGFGQVRLDGGDLTVGAVGSSTIYFGTIVGTFGLTKIGNGLLMLTEDNTYSGLTRVLAGTLRVDGSQPHSPVNVIGAVLEGNGTVGHLTSSGRVSPGGLGPDALSTSNLVFQSGGSLEIQIGANSDRLVVRGSVQLANATLNLSLFPGFLPPSGASFVILNNDGADAIVGTFGGLPNNALVSAGEGKTFRIQYNGGDGNDVMLTFINETIALRPMLVSVGNGDGGIDPNECNLLGGSVSNRTSQTISNVTLEFFPRSPGVTLSHPVVHLGQLNPHAVTVVPPEFVVSVGREVPCSSTVGLELIMKSGGVFVSSTPQNFVVGPTCSDGGGVCVYCPDVTINGSLMPGDLEQSSQLRSAPASTCARESSCPGAGSAGARLVDAMVFQNGPGSACVSITLSNRCATGSAELFAAAYAGKYNPSDLCENYLADSGDSAGAGKDITFSFRAGANEVFVIAVNEFTAASGCRDYTVRVSGGDCRPRLQIANIPGPNVRLSWPNSAVEWRPEISTGLATWSDLIGTPTNATGRIHLDTSGTQPMRFFRLRKP